MDAEEKKWNGTRNMWWMNIDMENENLLAQPIFVVFQKFLLPMGAIMIRPQEKWMKIQSLENYADC